MLQFANGNVLFLGFALSICAYGLRLWERASRFRALLAVVAITGGLLVLLSAAPFPLWAYVVWFACLAACILVFESRALRVRQLQLFAVSSLTVASIIMTAVELPYHRKPSLVLPKNKVLVVIGDSISMSTEVNVEPWPNILGQMTGMEIKNMAAGGNTVKGAIKDANMIDDLNCSVLLEIGGNDLLDGASAWQFEADMSVLMTEVCKPGRVVGMFEIPLVPFKNGFGRIQRRYAKTYGVTLIPKRYMTTVFGTPDATVDGLHLAKHGHDTMASLLNDMIED